MYTDDFRIMFREYDIRGRVTEKELNRDSVSLISKGFASFLAKHKIKSVVIGYDNRKCSAEFADAAIESCVSSGIKVYDIGLRISPALYFAQYLLKSIGAIMITASHNPDGWSGFKLAHGYSMTLGPEEIKELYNIIEKHDFVINTGGSTEKVNIREAYIDSVVSRLKLNKGNAPRVVIDAGNGGAGLFAYEIFQKIGCTTFQLNCDPDMNYPHYFPNPSDITARNRLTEMVLHPYIHADYPST